VAHGEEAVSIEFAQTLKERFGWNAEVPYPGARRTSDGAGARAETGRHLPSSVIIGGMEGR